MIIQKVAIRYSKALFNLVSDNKNLEKYLEDLKFIVNLLRKNPNLQIFFNSPEVSLDKKKKILENTLGTKIDAQLLKHLLFLLDKRRFQYLQGIAEEFEILVKEKLGMIDVKFITSVALEKSVKDKLVDKLQSIYQKTVNLIEEVDPKLLGGGILIIGNQMIDFSIQGKLKSLKQDLLT